MSLLNSAALFVTCAALSPAATPDVQTIIQKSVQANARDFAASPHFDHKERDHTARGTKTVQVVMINGSPYMRLISVNGKPLSASQAADEQRKEAHEREKRAHESPEEHARRVAKYERERHRDNEMMNQLTKAFDFKLVGTRTMRGFAVYVLRATPKPGYQPPNTQTQVLPGMQGDLWIDQKTFQWVKVTAEVIQPVSIDGFLAEVEPGTRFELEKAPAGNGSVWFFSHFAMRASAKVLFLVNHNAEEDDTFWDYTPAR